MERLEISKLFSSYEELGGKEITVCGWIKTLRDSKAIGFMEINDGSCFKSLQVVFESAKVGYSQAERRRGCQSYGYFSPDSPGESAVRAQRFFS